LVGTVRITQKSFDGELPFFKDGALERVLGGLSSGFKFSQDGVGFPFAFGLGLVLSLFPFLFGGCLLIISPVPLSLLHGIGIREEFRI